jgi:hypothetical protein
LELSPNAFTIEGFCQAYSVRRSYVFNEMKAGRLHGRKAGRKTLIRKIDADEWLNSLPKRDENQDGE